MLRRSALLGIALGLVWMPPAWGSGGGACSGPITSSDDNEVVIEAFCYSDTVVYVDEGESVTWTNEDYAPHTITGANNIWGDYRRMRRDSKRAFRFTEAGVYPYYCVLHPGMTGAVVVGDASGDVGDIRAGSVTPERPGAAPAAELKETSAEVPSDESPRGMVFTLALVIAFAGSALVARRAAKRRARTISGAR